MQTSTDAQHFFETDAAQERRQRQSAKAANAYGHPVVLRSKVLAVLADPTSASHVFVAESAGTVRRVNVDASAAPADGASTSTSTGTSGTSGTSSTSSISSAAAVYRGPTAPVTCLAIGGEGDRTLFAGSWDKTVWSFDRTTRQAGRTYAGGHADFVKAVVCGRLGGQPVLISGGADKTIIVWDVASGARLHTLQDSGGGSATAAPASTGARAPRQSMLAVQDLAIDPVATTADEILLVSASSDPHIRRWRIRRDSWQQVAEEDAKDATPRTTSLLAHETTVYKLVFDDHGYAGGGDADDDEEVDLWTCSADGTAKCLSRLHGFRHGVTGGSGGSNTYEHGSHVRAVAVTDAWVITAGRDEDLQYWDRTGDASGRNDDDDDDNKGANARYATVVGHYDEVTGLAVLADRRRLCSVSLDGTVRTWPLAKAELDELVAQQAKDRAVAAGDAERDGDEAGAGAGEAGLMTAEEEAELAALMEDD